MTSLDPTRVQIVPHCPLPICFKCADPGSFCHKIDSHCRLLNMAENASRNQGTAHLKALPIAGKMKRQVRGQRLGIVSGKANPDNHWMVV